MRSRLLGALVALLLLAVPAASSASRQDSPPPHATVWIDQTTDLSQQAIDQALEDLARQAASPQHVVVLVHGFATPRSRSQVQYDVLGPRVRQQFERLGRSVAVLGIQWDSAAQGSLLALPWEYGRKVTRARGVGRLAVRKLLLAVQDRFPESRVSLLGHSMGCEVLAAAATPGISLGESDRDLEVFQPERPLRTNAVVLLGSDLDYDAGYRSKAPLGFTAVDLLWMTMSRLHRPERDKVLDLRALIRGRAQGATFPRFTRQQYEAMFNGRKAVFDNQDIPPNHDFVKYYDEKRLARIIPSIVSRTEPGTIPQPADLAAIDQVMEAPGHIEALRPFLDGSHLSGQFYAAWRLEHLLGDGATHFEDEILARLGDQIQDRPRLIRQERRDSPCAVVREGLWPTDRLLARLGAPTWANPLGGSWQKDFQGRVVDLSGSLMRLETEFGDLFTFDLASNRTRCTPSLDGLRVGSWVRVRADFNHEALEVRVLTLPRWLEARRQPKSSPILLRNPPRGPIPPAG